MKVRAVRTMAPGHSGGPPPIDLATKSFNSWKLNGVTVTGTVSRDATDLGTPTCKYVRSE